MKFLSAATVAFCPLLWSTPLSAQTVYPLGTTIWQQGRTQDGYTLFIGGAGTGVLVDMDGNVVNTWVSPVAGDNLSDIHPLSNGDILVLTGPQVGPKRTALQLDYFGTVVWSWTMGPEFAANTTLHHDLERLPNGNTLLLGREDVVNPLISPDVLKDDFLVEVDPSGQVVWTWHTHEHFDQFGFDDDAKALISSAAGDWAHANSISPIPANDHGDPRFAEGNIIVSHRFTNTVFVIDKPTGDIVWQLGPTPEQDQRTYGQHAAHMIEQGLPGAGNILIFDNGSGTGYPLRGFAPGYATVPEIDPLTKDEVWRYSAMNSGQFRHRFNSYIVSNAQRLANGNTLICSGVRGRFFEVEAVTGDIVWEYMSPFLSPGRDNLVYRCYRVPLDWIPVTPISRRQPVLRTLR